MRHCIHLALCVVVCHVVILCGVAHSQDASSVAIEGHVFNAKTHAPLENALIS